MLPKNNLARIGTSNIVLPVNKTQFPTEYRSKSRLVYYASLFNTVEINSSFYKVPQAKTFSRWAAEVPDEFRFSVKLWKEITHAKNLDFSRGEVVAFMKAAAALGGKRGCLLVQFPGSVTIARYRKMEALLSLLVATDAEREWQIAVEFRHKSWYVAKVYELLDVLRCNAVLHDMKGSATTALNEAATAVYLRFHGTAPNYQGSYSPAALSKMAKQIGEWTKAGKEVYVYFNNTLGDAFNNATALQQLVRENTPVR